MRVCWASLSQLTNKWPARYAPAGSETYRSVSDETCLVPVGVDLVPLNLSPHGKDVVEALKAARPETRDQNALTDCSRKKNVGGVGSTASNVISWFVRLLSSSRDAD